MTERRIVTDREWRQPLTSFADARAFVLDRATALPTQTVALAEARGLIAAEDVDAEIAVPPYANASMDGYAVVTDGVRPGDTRPVATLEPIATGAPLPAGTDAVVPWEHTARSGDDVVFNEPVTAGQYVRDAGHDFPVGTRLLTRGEVLNAVRLGVLASAGLASVSVVPRPRVGVLISGDEFETADGEPKSGVLYDVNTVLLPTLLNSGGADVVRVVRAADTEAGTRNALDELVDVSDVIVTTGGASVGDRDWVRTTLEAAGRIDLWRVAVRPGKPFAFGAYGDRSVLVLPGNPGSVLACTHAFVTPFLRACSGHAPFPAQQFAELRAAIVNDQARTFLCPVHLVGSHATPLLGPSSQGLLHARGIDGFVIVEPSVTVPAGATVAVELA